MNRTLLACLAFATLGCHGFVGEVAVEEPTGPPIPIVDSNYVVLRAVHSDASTGHASESVHRQQVHFDPKERLLDLRHFDARTAAIEKTPHDTYVVFVRTTDEGEKLLGAWTAANIEKQLGIFLDDRLISAPVIKSRIDGMIVLDGDFTKEQAEAVLTRLRRGGAAV